MPTLSLTARPTLWRIRLALSFSIFVGIAVHAAALAREPSFGAERHVTTLQSANVSLEEAVAMVQARYGAKVMRANTVTEEGRLVHYIRLMTADRSRVWTVRVDAATGREF